MTKWKKYNGALVPDQPPHVEIDVNRDNLIERINRHKVYFARWTTNFDCKKPTKFWFVICDTFIPLDMLSRNTRNNVRRGLKRTTVEKVNVKFIIDNCYPIYKKAFDNYSGHISPISHLEFIDEYNGYYNEHIWDFWIVRENESNNVIAFTRNKIENDQCELCTTKFHPDFLRKFYPSEALFYKMSEYYLKDRKLKYINDGARSISHHTNIQSFLIQKFGFRKAYCKLNIIYSKPVDILVKILYPIRILLRMCNFGLVVKLNILLHQEEIRKSFD